MKVLAQYGLAAAGLRWVPVEGGFSGAHVWRGEDTSPVFALKVHPPHIAPGQISQVYAWIRRAAHLSFVPAVIPTTQHATFAIEDGRVWELVRWMPGEPGISTPARLTNAVAALAELHRVWTPPVPRLAPCPGVLRRLALLRSWESSGPVASEQLRRARDILSQLAPLAIRPLLPWAERPLPVQPCLCDIHADHVLFEGDTVTGVIDFSAMKLDNVGVDLARLLDSIDANDEDFLRAVSEYRAHHEIPADAEFVRLLARIGTLCAVVTWCRRLAASPPELLDTARFCTRFGHVLRRATAITPSHLRLSS